MSAFYANITLSGPSLTETVAYLTSDGVIAYVSSGSRGTVVIFHEDMGGQEALAAGLSRAFACPALLVMGYGESVLLYNLYRDGKQIDSYVSSPAGDLELDGPPPPGDAAKLCAAFAMERAERRVASILSKETKPNQPYALAANRHGELAHALGLPTFAAGAGFQAIEIGEAPLGNGFDLGKLVRTPAR